MALVTYGPIVSNARKKIAGVVATKGHAGNFLRTKVAPIQPRTTAQRNVRANFTALAKMWQTIGATAIAAFNALAATTKKKDRLGNAVTPTGMQLFMSLNRALQQINATAYPLTTPPPNLVATSPGTLVADTVPACTLVLGAVTISGTNAVYAVTAVTGGPPIVGSSLTTTGYATAGNNVTDQEINAYDPIGMTVSVTKTTQVAEPAGVGAGAVDRGPVITPNNYPAVGEAAVVFAAAPISAGKTFVGKVYRFMAYFGTPATPASEPYDISAAYAAKFGSFTAGKTIPVLVKHVSFTTGAAGIPTATMAPTS
jgi:hypothetical protein